MRINDVRLYPVSFAVKPEFVIQTSLGVHSSSHYVMLAVECSDGTIGWGEATVVPIWSGETQGSAMAALKEIIVPVLRGRDPFDVERIMSDLDRVLVGNSFTKAAVEMALLDSVGKHLNIPLYKYLGGASNPLRFPIKFSIGTREPEDAAKIALDKVNEGFRAIKVKVGTNLAKDLLRVRLVREAIGPDILLNLDVNGGWGAKEAIRNIPMFYEFDVEYVEQPTPREDIDALAEVRNRVSVPIMADESVFSVDQAYQVISKKAADVISIYPGKNGGILKSRLISQMAASAGIACHIGSNLEWDIATSAMCQLAACCSNVTLGSYPPDVLGPLYYKDRLSAPVEFSGGQVSVPAGPGLGLVIDESEIAELSRRDQREAEVLLASGGK
jgi:L-alanine-DL-glutamate epimerase-like enolase superfamily enzyme